MDLILGINQHQRGQKEAILSVLKEFKPKKYIQVCRLTGDVAVDPDEVSGVEVITFDLNRVQYGYFDELLDSEPLDNSVLGALGGCETECYLLLERLLHERYNEEIKLNKSDKSRLAMEYDLKNIQSNSYLPKYDFIDKKNILYNNFRFWNHLFDEERPDICFLPEAPSTIIPFIFYQFCSLKKVKMIFSEHIVINGYRVFIDDYKTHCIQILDEIEKINLDKNTSIKLNSDFQKEYDRILANASPVYMAGTGNFMPSISYTKSFKKPLKEKFKSYFNINYWYVKLFKKDNYSRGANLRKYYESLTKPSDYSQKFVYVPLHMQPEKTSIPLGGIFGDQLLMIEMLSYYLPDDYFIYVKENPKQGCDYRSIRFYESLDKINNVQLISTGENTFSLLKKACAVATLTGTIALESVVNLKPVFLFGYSSLQYLEGVSVIRDRVDCKREVEKLVSNEIIIDQKSVLIYLKALEKISAKLPFYNKDAMNEDEYVSNLQLNYLLETERYVLSTK